MDNDAIISKLLESRGLTDADSIREFFHPPHPKDIPLEKVGLDESAVKKAVQLIKQHMDQGHVIAVYGDYDVDGVTSTAILWETLNAAGAKVFPHIPHRKGEGYGLSDIGIDACLAKEAKLVITVDNGIVAHSQVEYAKSSGADVIIIDHHEPGETYPPADVIVHSTRTCAAAISWFFAREFTGMASMDHLALAAVGVVCDIVPLLGINRSIVAFGLPELRSTRRPGLVALYEEAGIDPAKLEAYHLGFVIGPRLNAMGRLEHALDSLRLLCTTQTIRARELAGVLGSTNRSRQQLTLDATTHAIQSLTQKYGENLPKLLVVADSSYDQGIIGLIAAKLVEKFYRPAVAISVGETESKASARSVAGFHVTEHLRTAASLMTGVGGHAMAAGFTLPTANLEAATRQLVDSAESTIDAATLVRRSRYDLEIPLSSVSWNLYERLQEFAPFGLGNPQPVFLSRSVGITSVRRIGQAAQHVKCVAGGFPAIAFNQPVDPPGTADVLYHLDTNTWNGRTDLQLVVKEIKEPHESLS